MSFRHELPLSLEEGIGFLEYLATNLTVAIRAANTEKRAGPMSLGQCMREVQAINDLLAEVLLLMRRVRIGEQPWDPEQIQELLDQWQDASHGRHWIEQAVGQSYEDLSQAGSH